MADPKVQPPKAEAEDEKKKGLLGKLEEITPDKEEQVALVGVAVRLGIVVWSGFILTLAYVDLPGFEKQNFDPTFIASVFTGALAGFSISTKDKDKKNGITKEDMEKMMTANNQASGNEQVIRIQTPLKLQSPDGEILQVVQEKPQPPRESWTEPKQ